MALADRVVTGARRRNAACSMPHAVLCARVGREVEEDPVPAATGAGPPTGTSLNLSLCACAQAVTELEGETGWSRLHAWEAFHPRLLAVVAAAWDDTGGKLILNC